MMRNPGGGFGSGQIDEVALVACLTKPILESQLRKALDEALGGSKRPVERESLNKGVGDWPFCYPRPPNLLQSMFVRPAPP